MPKSVTLKIDGREVTVPEGTVIVDAAKTLDIDIPVFCYHPKMEPVGMCRLCLVQIGRPVVDRTTGQPQRNENGTVKVQVGAKMETACTTPVTEGMEVHASSPESQAARKDILEFLLTSHPLDCPICDKGGECPLQNLTLAYGPGQSRFIYNEKMRLAKHFPLGELIVLDRERCIQCGRCVRFQHEIVDDPVLNFYQRGRNFEIVTYSEPGFDSYFSGNTTDICPVGALTTVDFRFQARPWEMLTAASLCQQCPVGCNTTLNVRREARSGGANVVKRVMPRQNENINEIWMCDKGRFAYHFAQSEQRLTTPMIQENGKMVETTWEKAYDLVAQKLKNARLVTLAGGRLANEDLFAIKKVTDAAGGQAVLNTHMAGGDLTAALGMGEGSNLGDLGKGSTIVVVACDLEEEAPVWWLRVKQAAERGATLIVANPRPTKLDRAAAHVLRYAYGSEVETVQGLLPASGSDIAALVKDAEDLVVFYGAEGIGLEASRRLSNACAELIVATQHAGKKNSGLVAAWPHGNTQGAWDMGFRPADNLAGAISGAEVLWVAAADPAGDSPALAEAVDRAGFVVVQELFMTETARRADVVLPVQSYIEREGTYTSGERHVQRFYPAVPPQSGTQADFDIAGAIAGRMGVTLDSRAPSLLMLQISREVPQYAGLSYPKLAEVRPQWPIIGRADLYYGGTSYDNNQGLGVRLASGAQRGETVSLAPVQAAAALNIGENALVAVPVTRLYDQGNNVLPSEGLLKLRITPTIIFVNPLDAARLGLDGGQVSVTLNGFTTAAAVKVDEAVPAGVALVPRSVGLPIDAPTGLSVSVQQQTGV